MSDDHISLTDMRKAKDSHFSNYDWLCKCNTVKFLGLWETVYNPDFNSGEFAMIGSQAGLNNYKLSVKQWVKKTNDIRRALVEADLLDTALRDSAFRQSEAKPQDVSETKDNFLKDDDVRWQWSGARKTAKGNPQGESGGIHQFGVPPKGNANFAWVQHFIHHLAPQGMAGKISVFN
jgi:hypothetical protein